MIAELNPETTEILETTESEEYIYQKVLFKTSGLVLGTRKLKTDNSTQSCLDEYVKQHLSLKEGYTGDIMKEFLKNSIVCLYLNKGLIEKDSETGLYYMEPLTMVRMIELASEHPYSSSIDWNVSAPNTLTVHGLLNVTVGAILGGFSIDNDKFESLAQTNGNTNILLNGFDGSGHLAGGNIAWDAFGNLKVVGVYRTADSGARIEIDPISKAMGYIGNSERVFSIWKATDQIVAMEFFTYKDNETTFNTRSTIGQRGVDLLGSNFIMQGGKIYLIGVPTNRNDAEINQVYLDGEALKVRKS